jgi:predicted DCC family thiol-disulfide oxidoreductase YuxK
MDEKIYYKSEAVIEIAKLLTGWPRILKYTKLVPKFLRDGIYNLVAKNRYSVFGKKTTCMMPSKSNKERFLIESSNYNK